MERGKSVAGIPECISYVIRSPVGVTVLLNLHEMSQKKYGWKNAIIHHEMCSCKNLYEVSPCTNFPYNSMCVPCHIIAFSIDIYF